MAAVGHQGKEGKQLASGDGFDLKSFLPPRNTWDHPSQIPITDFATTSRAAGEPRTAAQKKGGEAMRNWKEFIRAEHALRAVDPDADDETLMALAADCLTAGRGPRYRPYIRHDPPCPLRHDWRGQNVVGITTTDREVA